VGGVEPGGFCWAGYTPRKASQGCLECLVLCHNRVKVLYVLYANERSEILLPSSRSSNQPNGSRSFLLKKRSHQPIDSADVRQAWMEQPVPSESDRSMPAGGVIAQLVVFDSRQAGARTADGRHGLGCRDPHGNWARPRLHDYIPLFSSIPVATANLRVVPIRRSLDPAAETRPSALAVGTPRHVR
jgi:hypothetical protein